MIELFATLQNTEVTTVVHHAIQPHKQSMYLWAGNTVTCHLFTPLITSYGKLLSKNS